MIRKLSTRISIALAAVALVASATPALAREVPIKKEGFANETPDQLKDVGIEEKLGSNVDLDLPLKNEKGETVTLRKYMADGKPVLLSLAYYSCPSLCNFHLNGLLDAFKGLEKPLGEEFNAVVVSIEPKETPALAAKKKSTYIEEYGRPEGANGWHFLVADQATIDALAKSVGFKYKWDEEQKQWAHTAAAFVLTPAGKISRYLYGIVFDPKTVRLSMIEASEGKVGTIVDKLVLFCFHFDPKTSKYSVAAFNVMRGGAIAIVLVLTAFVAPFWFRSRKDSSKGEGEAS